MFLNFGADTGELFGKPSLTAHSFRASNISTIVDPDESSYRRVLLAFATWFALATDGTMDALWYREPG